MEEAKRKLVEQCMSQYRQLKTMIHSIPGQKGLFLLRYASYLQHELSVQEDPNIVRTIQTRLIDLRRQLELGYTENTYTQVKEDRERLDSITLSIDHSNGERGACINVLYALRGTTLALPLDPVELSAIPVPSTLQIRKDLQRESLRVNGLLCNGASSLSNVRKTLFDVIGTYVTIDDATDVRNPDASKSVDGMQSTCTDSSDTTLPIDQILESISRTRIGEYCYNLLLRCFPLQSSALILKVDNTESIPIDLNLNCALFKEIGRASCRERV